MYVEKPGVVMLAIDYKTKVIVLTVKTFEEKYTVTEQTPMLITATTSENTLTLSRTSGELYIRKSKDNYPVAHGTCTKAVSQF
jgi:ribosomal protein S11